MSAPHPSIRSATPLMWVNPLRLRTLAVAEAAPAEDTTIGTADMLGALARFKRFAPLLAQLFPELEATHGQIESALLPLPAMQAALGLPWEMGRLWLKADHSLPVAGSVKARGGFYEVLELTERLALQHGLIDPQNDYRSLHLPAARAVFSRYQVAVGSTGNLGMSIGVLAAALGFRAVVHMSADAKEWKKARLRQHGVEVIEHAGDYEQAVNIGRQQAQGADACHFVDDERSVSLFLGYSCAAFHLQTQLTEQGVVVDDAHPLLVYIPCGVGGAPAGIAWGLHQLLGRHVHCYFAEPTQSPCFLIQMLAPAGGHPSVYDYGLSNRTEADGLAVPRASLLAASFMQTVLAGVFTVEDASLFQHLALLHATQGLRIEPSAAAGFSGPLWLRDNPLSCPGATHLVWTTGGSLVPELEYQSFLARAQH